MKNNKILLIMIVSLFCGIGFMLGTCGNDFIAALGICFIMAVTRVCAYIPFSKI